MLTKKQICDFEYLAVKIRADAVMMTNLQHSGHVGSSLSMADLLVVLFEKVLNVAPKNPKGPNRDRFILSKGHAAAGLYSIMAEKGFFPKDWLETYYCDNGKLCGHISHHVPGVEFSTGSLGHGLPVTVGMALDGKRKGKKHRVFCLMSDGDCNEGSTWEAIMLAAQHKLDNLVAIVDYNKVQALGFSKDVINLEPFAEKMNLFGWAVKEIDGHNFEQILDSLSIIPFVKGKPSFLIAHTVKGKGISCMENTVASHYKCVADDKLEDAYKELGV
ncbi:MAG: transketolase [Planctomycetes bacterium GWC2_45_44]|nr:MAG: transketolase [Planctomycetes bacterium GWC2_45_44]HBR19433.1 transketolase [Phycisphaerales bacterium]